MRIIKNAKRAWTWFSVQAFVLATAMQATWAGLPPDMKASLPAELVTWATIAICILGLIGRLIDQGGGDD